MGLQSSASSNPIPQSFTSYWFLSYMQVIGSSALPYSNREVPVDVLAGTGPQQAPCASISNGHQACDPLPTSSPVLTEASPVPVTAADGGGQAHDTAILDAGHASATAGDTAPTPVPAPRPMRRARAPLNAHLRRSFQGRKSLSGQGCPTDRCSSVIAVWQATMKQQALRHPKPLIAHPGIQHMLHSANDQQADA